MADTLVLHHRVPEHTVLDAQFSGFGVVQDLHTQPLSGVVVGVHQCPATAKKEGVGPRQAQSTAQRRLEAHTVGLHPVVGVGGLANDHTRQLRSGLAGSYPQQVIVILLFRIGTGENALGAFVHTTEVACVLTVAATQGLRCVFNQQYLAPALGSSNRRTERRIATTNDKDFWIKRITGPRCASTHFYLSCSAHDFNNSPEGLYLTGFSGLRLALLKHVRNNTSANNTTIRNRTI